MYAVNGRNSLLSLQYFEVQMPICLSLHPPRFGYDFKNKL